MVTIGEWTDALRSGKYKQTNSALRRGGENEGMCCLGVLCDLVDPSKWGSLEESGIILWDGYSALPPDELSNQICKLFHIIDDFSDEHESVATYNDAGTGFSQIADIIESDYPRTREIVWSDDVTTVRLASIEAELSDLGEYAPNEWVQRFRALKAAASLRPLDDEEIAELRGISDTLSITFTTWRINSNKEDK